MFFLSQTETNLLSLLSYQQRAAGASTINHGSDANQSKSGHTRLLTFTGGGDGAVIPLQVGGGEGGEGVQGQAVGAGQPLLKVQQVLGFVVFRHVGGHVQIRHILFQRHPEETLHTHTHAHTHTLRSISERLCILMSS